MGTPTTGAVPDPESLKKLIAGLRELPPRVRRDTRRDLRRIGDETIAAQRAILAEPAPPVQEKTGQRRVGRVNRKTGKWYTAKVNTYGDRAPSSRRRERSGPGLREQIAAGLRLAIVAGKTRTGLELRTTGPKRHSYNMAKVWQKKHFRHPVFGRRTSWVDRAGQPYFFAPALAGRDDMMRRAEAILSAAIDDA